MSAKAIVGSATPELWRFRGLLGHLTQRQLKLRYKKSVLGWLWSLITPLATLGIYTLVFGSFLRVEPPVAGNEELKSYALFLFCALVVFNLFSTIVTGSMNWLLDSGDLLRKVYFPPETPVMAGSLATMVQGATEAAVLVAVFAYLGNLSWTALLLPLLLVLVMIFAAGIGLVASVLNVYFRDVSYIVTIGMTILFYATPIVYPFSIIPEDVGGIPVQDIIRLNPLTQYVGTVRDVLYDLRMPPADRLAVLVVLSGVTFAAGWGMFRRYGARLSEDL